MVGVAASTKHGAHQELTLSWRTWGEPLLVLTFSAMAQLTNRIHPRPMATWVNGFSKLFLNNIHQWILWDSPWVRSLF
jgi:hypothetical protein